MPKVLSKKCTQNECGFDQWSTQISSSRICWGPTMKDLIPKVGGRIKESVFVTGCPGVGDVARPDSIF